MTGPTQGEEIHRWRKQRGMIQRDLAEALDVSQSTISAWERDRYRVPASKVRPLCHAIGGNAEELKAAIRRTEFEEDELAITTPTDTVKATPADMAVLVRQHKQQMDRFESIIGQLVAILQRLEKTAARR